MTDKLTAKLQELPKTPGVYFHKNAAGDILYIGKAAVLRNRVRQYFQKSRTRDPKTDALVAEITDVDWIEVETELDALFLEAELVRRYLPPYNILLRDDKSLTYVRINIKDQHPTVSTTRRPLDDGAQYFGPYFSGLSVRRALKYLRKIFPYSTHVNAIPKRACLQAHLGLCPGLESNMTELDDYRADLKKLIKYLKGERVQLMNAIEKDMYRHAKKGNYEAAAAARNKLFALRSLKSQIIFSDREFLDMSKDEGLTGLAELLSLFGTSRRTNDSDTAEESAAQNEIRRLRRIEGFDISHMSGTDNVASMVVFNQGIPEKAAYRKFKLRIPGNNDFAHMNEAITRRLSAKNRNEWGLPDLFLIDGGKGQLSSAISARDAAGMNHIPMIGLAKREEEIVIHIQGSGVILNREKLTSLSGFVVESDEYQVVQLPHSSHIVKLLQRIRDESHRFAVSYHSTLKTKRQTASMLDEIPTIGPITRKKLIRHFGSMRGVLQARQEELVQLIGDKKAVVLRQYLRPLKKGSAKDIDIAQIE